MKSMMLGNSLLEAPHKQCELSTPLLTRCKTIQNYKKNTYDEYCRGVGKIKHDTFSF